MKTGGWAGWLLGLAGMFSCLRPAGECVMISECREDRPVPERIYFNYSNTDTSSQRDIVLSLRYTEKFGHDRIRFRFECLSPTNRRLSDTLSLELFDPETRRFEDGKIAARYNLERCIVERAVFGERGVYRMTLIPTAASAGVTSVGLVVRKRE